MRRLISGGVGLIFKGNGFYVTDYKKSNLPMIRDKKKKDLQKVSDKPKPLVKKEPNQAKS